MNLARWVQPDSIIPNLNDPLSLDRFAYVNNNPVNFNDPTGHKKVYIHSPLVINYSKDIPENKINAQQKFNNDPNLCGQISLAVILEAMTNTENQLGQIITTQKTDKSLASVIPYYNAKNENIGTDPKGLAYLAEAVLPKGTTITNYYCHNTGAFAGDGSQYAWKSDNPIDMSIRDNALDLMIKSFQSGSGVIVDSYVDINTGQLVDSSKGSGHWVVIANINYQNVTVYNSYNKWFPNIYRGLFLFSLAAKHYSCRSSPAWKRSKCLRGKLK